MLNRIYESKFNNTIIILPETLSKQSGGIISSFNILGFNRFVKILSDQAIKLNLLQKNYQEYIDGKTLFIIDEFDSVYNPLSSNLNIPSKKISIVDKEYNTLANYVEKYINIIIDKLEENNYNFNINLKFKIDTIDPIEIKLIKTLDECTKMKYNFNYGLTQQKEPDHFNINKYNENKFISFYKAIPYACANTPIEQSEFSEIDFIFILTILSIGYTKFRELDYSLIAQFILEDIKKYSRFDDMNENKMVKIFGIENINLLLDKKGDIATIQDFKHIINVLRQNNFPIIFTFYYQKIPKNFPY
jgi:hypothetical protein